MSRLSSRRHFLKMSAGSLLAAGLWPGCAARQHVQESLQPLKFIEVNDLHFTDAACAPYFEKLVKELKTYDGMACCLVVGDLTDNGTPAQFAGIQSILNKLKMPYHVVIGNHDYKSQTDRTAYEAAYPKSINTTWELGGWRFMGLDTSDGVKYENVAVNADTLSYVKQSLVKIDKSQPLILYTHFPLGEGVKYRLTNADATLDLFRDHNLLGIFNGHYHGYTLNHFKGGEVTTNKCCSRKRDNHDGTKEKGYFVCGAGPAGLSRRFVEFISPA